MTSIHHATVKAAAAKGFMLTVTEAENVQALHAETNVRVILATDGEYSDGEATTTDVAKDAWAAAADIIAYHEENPTIRIRQMGEPELDFVALKVGPKGAETELARDPVLEDLFESLRDPEILGDDGEQEAEEDEDKGSVVPPVYKKLYKERGNPAHCGDWLAVTLNGLVQIKDEKGKVTTDLDRLEAIAAANDVETPRMDKLGRETNGWQGRYRMTVRNMLTKRIAAKGFLFVPEGCGKDTDTEIKAPAEWLAAHTPKARPTAKEKAAVSKDEGAGKASKKTRAKKGDQGERGLAVASKALKDAAAKRAK